MQLNILPLNDTDYDNILYGWWKDWRWTPPVKEFLPEGGKGGFIVYDGNIPVCAGFIYITNSEVVWCDWIISNIKYKDRVKRKEALELLINTITTQAKLLKKKYIYAADVVRIIVGDSIVLKADLGFDVWINKSFRLNGIDTPESRINIKKYK